MIGRNEVVEDIDILTCISLRENLVERLKHIVAISDSIKPKQISAAAREIVSISKDLREIGLKCVQRIVTWTLQKTQERNDTDEELNRSPPMFLWEGMDYLTKMLNDLDFAVSGLPSTLAIHGNFAFADPLFIKRDKSTDQSSRRAAVAATLIVLDAAERKAELEAKLAVATDETESFQTIQQISPLKPSKSFRINLSHTADRSPKADSSTFSEEEFSGEHCSYLKQNPIGKDPDTKIFECERHDGRRFVVKILSTMVKDGDGDGDMSGETIDAHNRAIQRELSLLRTIAMAMASPSHLHPAIVAVEEIVQRDALSYVVMERMSHSLLQMPADKSHYLNESSKLSSGLPSVKRRSFSLEPSPSPEYTVAVSVLQQILHGLNFLHSQNIIHGDIRPGTILISPCSSSSLSNGTTGTGTGDVATGSATGMGFLAKISNFSSAVTATAARSRTTPGLDHHHHVHVTSEDRHHPCRVNYLAPELLANGREYGPPVDVWALSCCIFEMVTNRRLAEGSNDQEVLDSIVTYHSMLPYPVHRSLEDRGLSVNFKKQKMDLQVDLGNVLPLPFKHAVESMLLLSDQERPTAPELLKMIDSWSDGKR
eukprot:gene10669-22266_t